MAIIVKCACGRTLKIDDRYRGKQAACKAPILVEGPSDAPAVPAEIEPETHIAPPKPAKPAKSPPAPKPAKAAPPEKAKPAAPAPPADDPANPFALPSGRCRRILVVAPIALAQLHPLDHGRLRRRHGAPVLLRGRRLRHLVLLLQGPRTRSRLRSRRRPGLHVLPRCRSHEIVRSQRTAHGSGQRKKEFDKKLDDLESKLGLKVSDIERATFIHQGTMNVLKSGTVVVTTKPLKKKRIFETFSSSQDKEEHNGAAYYVFKRNGEVTMVLHFASDRIVLVTRTAEAMKSFLEGKDKPPTDPAMKRAVRLASSGSYSFVVAVKGNHSVAAAAPGANFTNFRAVTGVFVTGTVDSKMQFEITGLFPNGDTAAKAKAEIEAFRDGKLDPRDGVPQGIQAREAKELFATIEQRGSELVVTGKAGAPIMQLVFLVQDLDLRAPEPPPKEDNPKTKKKGPPDPVEPEP